MTALSLLYTGVFWKYGNNKHSDSKTARPATATATVHCNSVVITATVDI